jgi:hypothetical protein
MSGFMQIVVSTVLGKKNFRTFNINHIVSYEEHGAGGATVYFQGGTSLTVEEEKSSIDSKIRKLSKLI